MEEEKLKQIYRLMYEKLREIQLENNFEETMEENRKFTYFGKGDSYFFQKLVSVIFESGIRAVVWKKYEGEARKEFFDYDVEKVADFTEEDIDRMLKNPKMFKNRKKIEACVYNAKQIVEISREYGGFSNFIMHYKKVPDIIEELKKRMKRMGNTNAYAFLKYCGAETVKPDINVRRIMYRLGLIEDEKPNPKTYKQIQEVGEAMARVNGVRVIEIDYLFYIYGSGYSVQYQVCGTKPRCEVCPLTKLCHFYLLTRIYEGTDTPLTVSISRRNRNILNLLKEKGLSFEELLRETGLEEQTLKVELEYLERLKIVRYT